jgi:hypothetical protein
LRVRGERGLDDGVPEAAGGAQGLQGGDGSVDGRVRALEGWEEKKWSGYRGLPAQPRRIQCGQVSLECHDYYSAGMAGDERF